MIKRKFIILHDHVGTQTPFTVGGFLVTLSAEPEDWPQVALTLTMITYNGFTTSIQSSQNVTATFKLTYSLELFYF